MAEFSIKAKLVERGTNMAELSEGIIKGFQVAVGGLAKSARSEWVRLAQERLTTSREDYVNGLRQAESFSATFAGDRHHYEIALVGRMPNNFEFGMSSFDMKGIRPGWLGGAKALTAKDGHKYIRIPFRHSPTSKRFAYTGKAKAVAAPDLRTQLREVIREYGLQRMVRTATGSVVAGPTTRVPSGAASVHPYLRGLTRVQQAYPATSGTRQRGSARFMTWRTMSENSPADSWIHPGLTGVNLLEDVERFVNSELDRIIDIIMGERSA